MRISRRESPLDLYNLVLGAFLIASPWLFHMTRESARIETWGAGSLLIAISVAALLAFSLWGMDRARGRTLDDGFAVGARLYAYARDEDQHRDWCGRDFPVRTRAVSCLRPHARGHALVS